MAYSLRSKSFVKLFLEKFAAGGSLSLFLFFSSPLAEGATVKASIGGIDCTPFNGSLTVPAGMRAGLFRVEGFGPGTSCLTGKPLKERGWGIKEAGTNKDVYRAAIDRKGARSEPYGPLEKLILPPGTYTLYVIGGQEALVEVTYTIGQENITPVPVPAKP